MTDVPGGGSGFEIASAFVSVDPDAATFEEQLVSQLDEIKYVVTIPVEADTAGLQASVDAAARKLLPAQTTFRDRSSLRIISVSCLNPPHFLSGRRLSGNSTYGLLPPRPSA